MKNIEELAKIRVEKRKELDLRKNTKADTREKHILVCQGTGCTSSKSPEILENFKKIIKEKNIENVRVIKTGCFGLCAKGPIVIIRPEDTFYAMVKPEDCEEIIESHILNGKTVERLLCRDIDGSKVEKLDDLTFYKKQKRIALKNCGVINPEDIDEYIAFDGYRALARAIREMTEEEVIDTISKSGLRGRGGAGFPTGKKWSLTKEAKGDVKYVVCNADEGDPGAFMDRSILEGDPHSVLEAMAIAGYAIGAKKGFIYVRAEYPISVKRLEIAINQAREYGILGKNILGSNFEFDIEIRLGAGAFVCGEETALLESKSVESAKLNAVRLEVKRELSKVQAEVRRTVTLHQNKLKSQIFSAVVEKLNAYKKTEEYKKELISQINKTSIDLLCFVI